VDIHPPGILGRDPSLWPAEDVEKAKQLLAEAGYPDGQGFPQLTYVTNFAADPLAAYVTMRWNDTLGVPAEVVVVEATMDQVRRSAEWEQNGDVYSATWFSDYVDPSNWFDLLWLSSNDPGQYNSGWKNEEFDRLVRAAPAIQDQGARTEQYRKAEAIIAREYPVIPLYYPAVRYLVKPNVKAFGTGQTGIPTPLSRVRIQAAPTTTEQQAA
jgi:oligopeptide transport system substrate-binding protein